MFFVSSFLGRLLEILLLYIQGNLKNDIVKIIEVGWGIYLICRLFLHGDFYQAIRWFLQPDWDHLINFLACYAILFPLPTLIGKYGVEHFKHSR